MLEEQTHDMGPRNSTTRPKPNRSEALGYARCGTGNQPERTIERQVDSVRRFAAASGITLVEVFVDRGVSGASGDREGLSAMLDFLRSRPNRPATVIVDSADRLARDTRIFVVLWDELKKLGVAVHEVGNGTIELSRVGAPSRRSRRDARHP